LIAIVVAHAANGVIGREGELPWRLPSDLRHFRELTTGHAVVMGRTTWESLPPSFRPLPERRNIVLSRRPGYVADGAEVFDSLDSALAACDGDCFVIGGDATYRQALPLASRVYATHVDADVEGDAYFSPLLQSDWRCVESSDPIAENGYTFTFRTFERAVRHRGSA
jgi:dihydrofolate reductase